MEGVEFLRPPFILGLVYVPNLLGKHLLRQ